MEENINFSVQLREALTLKSEWFNTIRLQELVTQYRILQTCVKNLYDALVKRTLIIPDPYRLDKKISDITVPSTSPFNDAEAKSILSTRFSEYEVMLDYICTYFRFTVENIAISTVKKLIEFNDVFDWENLSINSAKSNTRALANFLVSAKTNAPGVIVSTITDNSAKCGEATAIIKKILNELGSFQKELYKAELRNDLCDHPEFDKSKAYTSADAELAEIKRLYKKVMGNKPFYTDLIGEIIQEDLGSDKERRQAAILNSLKITAAPTVEKKVKNESESLHDVLMSTVLCIASMAPTLLELENKLKNNFELLYRKKKSFFTVLVAALRKVFHVKEQPKICSVNVKDARTGSIHREKIFVQDFLLDLSKRQRIYAAIAQLGPEYTKLKTSPEDVTLQFVNKQISETQSLFSKINALDEFFKNETEVTLRVKIKGMQIELTALRNTIINANKKRGEYTASKEEAEQMKKLGITE